MMTVAILGLGYIGLPTAAVLASSGYRVIGVDISESVVSTINQGRIHIVERDLEDRVREAVASGALRATTEVKEADVFMICVPTPFVHGEGIPEPDLSYVEAAAREIAPVVRAGNLVILESTSPVGTTERVREAMGSPEGVHFAYCPERVLPGRILQELVENDRIVGGLTPEATEAAREFYASFLTKGSVFGTDAKTAEMTKLTENAFRDVNIAFANELSLLCDRFGVDVFELIRLANRHPRVNILEPRCGVGGHCIAVDPWFLVSAAPDDARLLQTARRVNDAKPDFVVNKVREAVQGRPEALVVCLGLAFKPNVDDLRESPAVEVAERLRRTGVRLAVVEPFAPAPAGFCQMALDEAIADGDVFVALVKHDAFVGALPTGALVLDFCGLLQPG